MSNPDSGDALDSSDPLAVFSQAADMLNVFHLMPANAADALYTADQCTHENYLDAGISAAKAVNLVNPSALLGPLAVPLNMAATLVDTDEVLRDTGLPSNMLRTLSR